MHRCTQRAQTEIRSDSFLRPNIHIAFVYVFRGEIIHIPNPHKDTLLWAWTNTFSYIHWLGSLACEANMNHYENLSLQYIHRLSSMKNWLMKCHMSSYLKSKAFQHVMEAEMAPWWEWHIWREGWDTASLFACVFMSEHFSVCWHFVPVELLTVCGCSCSV